MTKKLFVVLVLAIAVIASSFVMAANRKAPPTDAMKYSAPVPVYPGGGERLVIDKTIPAKLTNLIPGEVEHLNWAYPPDGALPYELLESKAETCQVRLDNGPPYYGYGGYVDGGEAFKMFCEPVIAGCDVPAYTFAVTKVYHKIYVRTGAPTVYGYFNIELADMSDPDCPKPGPEIWTSDEYYWGPIPYPGYIVTLSLQLDEAVCVRGPFFVSFHYTDSPNSPAGDTVSVATDQTMDICQSYYNWGAGWMDFYDVGFSGNSCTYCDGISYADPENACPAVPECEYLDPWHDGVPYYTYSGYDAGAVWYQSPKMGYIARARILFSTSSTGSPEAWFYLWDGNPTTGPVNKIDSIYVPNSDIVYDPDWVEVDFTSHNITVDIGDYIFFGHEAVRPTVDDDLWWLSDYNGNGVETHSWLQASGVWYDEYSAWYDYAEYMMELEICGEAECDEPLLQLPGWAGSPTYFWRIPDAYGDDFMNERFQVPFTIRARLDKFEIPFYVPSGRDFGTPDGLFYVWLSDGVYPLDDDPPNGAMASYYKPHAELGYYPTNTVVWTFEDGLYFDPGEMFHVGYSQPQANIQDSLACLSSADVGSDRALEWWGAGWGIMGDDWGVYVNFIMHAYVCPFEPPESTFALQCSPALNYATPGDPPVELYAVNVTAIVGYNLPVTLTCTPPAGINVSFDPNGQPCPYISNVSVSVDPGVSYGDYTLTFCGTGDDAQVKCCNVTLTVQPPYDDALVEFYHGKQRMTNFGAVGDHDNSAESFLWYGVEDLLFDGTFIVATGPNNMALDFGRTHVYSGFVPSQHQEITYEAKWPANIGYAEFSTDPTIIDTEWDSLFVIGIMDECVDFSIKIKIYYNPSTNTLPIENMYLALFEDWDFGDAYNNWGALDFDHNLVWEYEPLDSSFVCGLLKAPFYDEPMLNVQVVHNAYITWPNEGYGLDQDSVWRLLTHVGPQEATYVGVDSQDYSVMITAPPITLYPGDKHIEIWIDFCRDLDVDNFTWEQWYHRVLRYVGFYRGDVNASDSLELPALDVSDLVYLINYLYRGGPAPLPFADQGDVDGKGPRGAAVCDGFDPSPQFNVTVSDLVYLLNYIYRGGPPPVDRVRFIEQCWTRPSLFENPNW